MPRPPMKKAASSGVGVRVGAAGADGLPQHQQFAMLRTTMGDKIYQYIGRKQSSSVWRRRLPELAKRLEEILYRKFPNKNDYYNMMKGPIEPQLQFAIKTLSAQNHQHLQNKMRQAASSSGTMIPNVIHDDHCQQSASLPTDTQKNADDLDATPE